MDKIYKKEYFVSANESNPEGELAVNVLVSTIIEVATAHANVLGIGNPVMKELNAGWVLSRLTIDMGYYPKVNSSFTVLTWVNSWNRHFSVRDFEILDENGNTAGFARSIWMVLNTVSHENFGLSHLTLKEDMITERECPVVPPRKHTEVTPNLPGKLYTFQYNDIDFYRHVNTVRYITLILNSFSLEAFDKLFMQRLELSFLHEGNFGERIEIKRCENREPDSQDISTEFSFFSLDKNIPILFARTVLRPR